MSLDMEAPLFSTNHTNKTNNILNSRETLTLHLCAEDNGTKRVNRDSG